MHIFIYESEDGGYGEFSGKAVAVGREGDCSS